MNAIYQALRQEEITSIKVERHRLIEEAELFRIKVTVENKYKNFDFYCSEEGFNDQPFLEHFIISNYQKAKNERN